MSDKQSYELAYLTEQWEWEGRFAAAAVEEAKAMARQALETLVREEAPELACVTLIKDGVKLGVWDWVGGRPYWTALEGR